MNRKDSRGLIVLASALALAGMSISGYGFSLLHSLEFGPADFVCPAYYCTFDQLVQAGYGWLVVSSYFGLFLFAEGAALLVASLLVTVRD
jgi:hypothetical protein